ncbi:MAG: M23 family metallopeptidase [Rikenellaceae bacterium]
MDNKKDITPIIKQKRIDFKKKLSRVVVHLFAGIGLSLLYYVGFSFFFDTPTESQLKESASTLKQEYDKLNNRYDSLMLVLDNIAERDNNVFGALFESTPYTLNDDFSSNKWATYEELTTMTNKELAAQLETKAMSLDQRTRQLNQVADDIHEQIKSMGDNIDYIPSIQPVINKELTALTASYGMRMQPFYKTMSAHQGIDYSVAEGSRVFATADGVVSSVETRRTSSGTTIVINHNDTYETTYSHLSKTNVRRGQKVKRGDIIAHSGNTGLSFAPHLHYEIKHKGMRVDPLYYFFMELSPSDYQKIIKIANSGMQSLD